MIKIKNASQIADLRLSGKILNQTLKLVEENIRPGISTKELDTIAQNFIKSKNAIASCFQYEGFPAAICSSINEEVVHGIPSSRRILKNGDIVSIDICVTYNKMVTDAARTFFVGDVSEEKKKLVQVTREAFYKSLEGLKEGSRVGDIGAKVQSYAESFGYGVVRDLTGHGVGEDLHEDPAIPNYGRAGTGARLYSGMVLAIEPMITMGTYEVDFSQVNGWTVTTRDKKPSAHYENTVVITKDGVEILTD